MSKKKLTYEQEGYLYHKEVWAKMMAAVSRRRLVMKAGTLGALGGASAINALLAACSAGGEAEQKVGEQAKEVETGRYKFSRYPMLEKYNWRLLPSWGTAPYVGGYMMINRAGSANWDFTRSYRSASTAPFMQNLLNLKYDPTGAKASAKPGSPRLARDLGDEASYEIPFLQLDMAEKVTAAPDFRYYDYKIRETYFHDIPPVNGRRVTAEDVVYSLESLRTVGYQMAPLEIVEKFVLIDKDTVRANMKRPVIWLDFILASPDYPIFAKEHYEGLPERWQGQLIGSSAFKLTWSDVTKGLRAEPHLKYNPGFYYAPGYKLPYMRGFEGIAITDAAARKAAFRTGQIDGWSVSASHSDGAYQQFEDMLATNPDANIQVSGPTTTYRRVELNLKNRLFQDVRVRRALNLALDRNQMNEVIVGGMGYPSHPISYQFLGRTDPLRWEELDEWHQYNPTRAKELLKEAGYPDGFTLDWIVTDPSGSWYQLIQQYLAAIGVTVKWEQVEVTKLSESRIARNYKGAILGLDHVSYHGVRQAMQEFLPDSPKNAGNIDDPKMTDLVMKTAYTVDADEMLRLLKEINDYGMSQCYAIETFSGLVALFNQKWLHNLAQAPSGWMHATGSSQYAHTWVDNRAPGDRAGRLKA